MERTYDASKDVMQATASDSDEPLALSVVERTLVEHVTSQENLHLTHLLSNLALAPIIPEESPPVPLESLIRCETLPPLVISLQPHPLCSPSPAQFPTMLHSDSGLSPPLKGTLFDEGAVGVANCIACFVTHLVHDQLVTNSHRALLVTHRFVVANDFTDRFRRPHFLEFACLTDLWI